MTPTLALCTVDDVLNSEGFAASQVATPSLAYRENLAQAILAFSQEVETETGRWFKRATWVETLDVEPGQRVLQLKAYPVQSVASVLIDPDGDFVTNPTTLAATDFALLSSGRSGQLAFRAWSTSRLWTPRSWGTRGDGGPATCQVTYAGGLATDVHQVPADLRLACIEQITLVTKRGANLDISGMSQSGGSVTFFRNAPLCSSAERAIERYRCHG